MVATYLRKHTETMLQSVLFVVLVLVTTLLFTPPVRAQTSAEPNLVASTSKQVYELGEIIIIDIEITNESSVPQQYGGVGPVPSLGRLRLVVDTAVGMPSHLYGYCADIRVGSFEIESSLTATSAGATKSGSIMLSAFCDVDTLGTHTITAELREQANSPFPSVSDQVTIEVILPSDNALATAAEEVVEEALRQRQSRFTFGEVDIFSQIIDTWPESHLYEIALFYRAENLVTTAVGYQVLADGERPTQEALDAASTFDELILEAEATYTTFLSEYSSSALATNAIVGLTEVRLIQDSTATNPLSIAADCGGNRYTIFNQSDEPQQAHYTVIGTGEEGDVLVLKTGFVSIETGDGGEALHVFLGGQIVGVALPNYSTCSAAFDLTALPSAATFASPSVEASFSGNSFLVSGLDHDLNGNATGSGEDRHGIAATDEAARQSILDELSSNQEANVTGQDPAPDIAVATPGLDVEALVDLLLSRSDLITLDADPGNQTVGTASEPVVAYAPDGLDVQGNFEGFGILVVEGTFEEAVELRGNASWTGLVIVRGVDGAQAAFDMSGNVEVIGAVVLQSDTGAVLDVGGSSSIRYSVEALQLAQSLLNTP